MWLATLGCLQDKPNYHCMVTGIRVELEKKASGPEMSNQESEKQSKHTKLDCIQRSGG